MAFRGRETAGTAPAGAMPASAPGGGGDAPTFGDTAVVLLLVQLQDGGAEAAVCLAQLAGHVRLPGGPQAGKEEPILAV